MSLERKRIVVVGGESFLGAEIVRRLRDKGVKHVTVPVKEKYDLRSQERVVRLYEDNRPHMLIYIPSYCEYAYTKNSSQAKSLYDALITGSELLEKGRIFGLEKFITVAEPAVYPQQAPCPHLEETLWQGFPGEEEIAGALSNRILAAQSILYKKDFNFDVLYLISNELYGPNSDNEFHPQPRLVSSIITGMLDARKKGNTEITLAFDPQQKRKLLFTKDCAGIVVRAVEQYRESAPLNIGVGTEISVGELAERIKNLIAFNGTINWQQNPNAAQCYCLDTTKSEIAFPHMPNTPLDEGLRQTIEWHSSNQKLSEEKL